MKILSTKVLKGPNYWSNYRKNLIAFKLDLGKYEQLPTNTIAGFPEGLLTLIPTLNSHYCSRGIPGGFAERLYEGTWLGHVMEHVALELQVLAGMDCGFGRTFSAHEEGVYHVLIEYEIESAGIYAGKTALKIVETLAKNQPYETLGDDIEVLKNKVSREGLGVSTKAIVYAAQKRNIPFIQIEEPGLILLGHGHRQKIISATLTANTSCIGVETAGDKNLTKKILSSAFISTPSGKVVSQLESLNEAINELGFPLTIKPLDGNHGRGVFTNITNKAKAIRAFKSAKKISSRVIVEHFVAGDDYRFLIVNYKLVAAAKRIPALVTGDAVSTIEELIDESNKDLRRGKKHDNVLTKIKKSKRTLAILQEEGFDFQTVPPKGKVIYLSHAANISAGGTAVDVTDQICSANVLLAERIARLMYLDVCGIDLIAKNIHEPLTKENGAIIEVNAAPGLRMHLFPCEGKARDVGKYIIDYLYPEGSLARIPIIAVTGTNGKTTTVRLIAHLMTQAAYKVGFTTTDGIYIENQLIHAGDCAGYYSARTVLRDPLVEFAVLECARGGILRSGLGFDQCDISVLLNISDDHLGLNDIDTLEELAQVKSVVPRSTKKDGHAILNADDDLVYKIKDELNCKIILFSTQANNIRIQDHCANGGLSAYIDEEGFIIIQDGATKTKLMKTLDIPLTFHNAAHCMLQNILAATLAARLSALNNEKIIQGLKKFHPTCEMLPGRMNLFSFEKCQVLVDYAHNLGAFLELKNYLEKISSDKKIGIIACPGDRRAEDIKNIGFYSAQMFDEIIIRHDEDGRGRTNQEITHLINEGITAYNPDYQAQIISDELEALKYALNNVTPNTFIVVCSDAISRTTNYLKFKREHHDSTLLESHISQGIN